MASSRHFTKNLSKAQIRKEIEADIRNARKAQKQSNTHAQYRAGGMMRDAVDEYLDELAALEAGTWAPKYA